MVTRSEPWDVGAGAMITDGWVLNHMPPSGKGANIVDGRAVDSELRADLAVIHEWKQKPDTLDVLFCEFGLSMPFASNVMRESRRKRVALVLRPSYPLDIGRDIVRRIAILVVNFMLVLWARAQPSECHQLVNLLRVPVTFDVDVNLQSASPQNPRVNDPPRPTNAPVITRKVSGTGRHFSPLFVHTADDRVRT